MKILNLYCGIGGNRKLWGNLDITAIEIESKIADKYKKLYPNDKVIVADAHEYLLDHYKEFDFIWSSPPCPTHSKARGWNTKVETKYPDMKLYEEIILLETVVKGVAPRFKGKYVVENVIPYYEPLILAQKRHRHLYWTNFNLPNILTNRSIQMCQGKDEIKRLIKFHDYDFRKYKGKQPVKKIARNLVDYEAGKTIFETVCGIVRKENEKQTELF